MFISITDEDGKIHILKKDSIEGITIDGQCMEIYIKQRDEFIYTIILPEDVSQEDMRTELLKNLG